MEFTNIYYLVVPVIILFLYLLFTKFLTWKTNVFRNLGYSSDVPQSIGFNSLKHSKYSFIAFCLALLSLSIALAEPKFIVSKESTPKNNSEILFVVDVSRSMLVNDLSATRLDIAKQIIGEITAKKESNFGLTAFAYEPYLLVPMTINKSALSDVVTQLAPDNFTNQGSDLSRAMESALKCFSDNASTKKTVILFSDGEFHEGNPKESIANLQKNKISLLMVSIGTETGGRVPLEAKDQTKGDVISKANHKVMEQLAPNGKHYSIDNLAALNNSKSKILEEISSSNINVYYSASSWFFFLSFCLLLVFWKL